MEDWTREAIFDSQAGADYLYDRHLITCVCVLAQGMTDVTEYDDGVNPANGALGLGLAGVLGANKGIVQQFSPSASPWNSLSMQGLTNGAGGAIAQIPQPPNKKPQVPPPFKLAEGTAGPACTLVDLFQRLRVPRKQLRIWLDSNPDLSKSGGSAQQNVLVSPVPGYEEDALHGPICSVMNPISLGSNASIALRLQFETHIGGCSEEGAPVLLSNRWSYTVSADENFYAIHKIDGEARFRMDLLRHGGKTADQFRQQFMHPIPIGFQREQPVVQIMPGGDTVRYSIVDRQMPLNFPGGSFFAATRIEIKESRQFISPVGAVAAISNFQIL